MRIPNAVRTASTICLGAMSPKKTGNLGQKTVTLSSPESPSKISTKMNFFRTAVDALNHAKGVFKNTYALESTKLNAPRLGSSVYVHPKILELADEMGVEVNNITPDFIARKYKIGYHGMGNKSSILDQLSDDGTITTVKPFFWTEDDSEARTYAQGAEPVILILEIESDQSFINVCPMHAKTFISEHKDVNILGIFTKGERLCKEGVVLSALQEAGKALASKLQGN
ncbi:MAG: hypothetical protein EB053_06785 [Chlamydiae bacterium]|jgi:hypothetical protein|nr:hypothetical protein [Chlamydiota bacterium]